MEHQDETTGNEPEWDPSEINSYRVIQEVKNYPVIYNPDHERYLDKGYRDEVWEKIFKALYPKYPEYCVATKVQIGILLRRRWKSLRNSIGHEVKVMIRDPESYRQKASTILTELMFVIPYIKSKYCEQFCKQMGLTKQVADDACTNSSEDVSVTNEATDDTNYDDFVQDFIKQEDEFVVYDVKEIDEADVDDNTNIVELTHEDAIDVKPTFLSTDHYESDDPISVTSTTSKGKIHPVELHTNQVNSQPQSVAPLKGDTSTTTSQQSTAESKMFQIARPKVTKTLVPKQSNLKPITVKYPSLRPSQSNVKTVTVDVPPARLPNTTQQSNPKPTIVKPTLQLSNPQSLAHSVQRDNSEESLRKRPRLDDAEENPATSMDVQQKLLDVLMTIEHRQLERDAQADNDPNDLDRMFLLSLLEDLKQISADKKIFVKAKIATILARAME